MEPLRLAIRNLWRRTTRTVVALLGVAVGVSVVVSIISSAGSLRSQFYRMAEEFKGDLIVTQKLAFVPDQSRVTDAQTRPFLDHPDVAGVSLIRFWRQPIKNSKGIQQPIMVLGLRPGDISLSRYPITKGRTLKPDDTDQALVGELLARDFGLELGDEVEALGHTFTLVGYFRSPVANVSFLSGGLIVPLPTMSRITMPDAPITGNMATVHVKGSEDLGTRPSADALAKLEARTKAVAESLRETHKAFGVQPIGEYLDSFRNQLEVIDQFAWAISLLSVLAGGIGIMNTMIMSVFERTREIGLLKALGWPSSLIMSTIVCEGGLLAVFGGIVGIPLGLAEVKLATYLIKLGWIEVTWDWTLFGQAIALAAIVGVLGSIYPAARAASFEPTEALRYE